MRMLLLIFLALTLAVPGETLVCEGVLGNSGVAGDSLASGYRYNRGGQPAGAIGMGVAVDSQGCIWSRTAPGVLARFAVDGRQLATFAIPGAVARTDRLTLVGERLVLLINGSIYVLPVDAAPGSQPQALNVRAGRMAPGSAGGKVALLQDVGKVVMLDPAATGEVSDWGQLAEANPSGFELGPDGAVYYSEGKAGTVHKLIDGAVVTDGWPRDTTGRRESAPSGLCLVNNTWFGFGWYGTIKRYTVDLEPAPGVVIGGSSGWFIGTVPGDSDLDLISGMAHLGDHLYAAAGANGVVLLLRWRPEEQRITLERRLGAMKPTLGIALDSQGRIFDGHGTWHWQDGPDAPYRDGFFARSVGQLSVLPGDIIGGPGKRYSDRPVWIHGAPNPRPGHSGYTPGFGMDERGIASTVLRVGNQSRAILLEVDGRGAEFRIANDGKLQAHQQELQLHPAEPVTRWTSLAGLDYGLLAAGDGAILHLRREGDGWHETARWSSWDGDSFGGNITLAVGDGRLWVADTERHRVLCFDVVSRRLLASYGSVDQPGAALEQLHHPEALSISGDRAILFDAGNYRLLKLRLLLQPAIANP